MKKTILLLALAITLGTPAIAKKKKIETPTEKKAPIIHGLFNVQHQKDSWIFQIPDSLLGQPFLATTRFVSTPESCGKYGGELANDQVFYWQKEGDKLILRSLIFNSYADSTSQISKAVKASTENPIVMTFKIDSTQTDSAKNHSYSINVTRLFSEDNQTVSIYNGLKNSLGLASLSAEKSYIKSIHTYPINTEIRTVKTYNCKESSRLYSSELTGSATFELNTSFLLLPKNPMKRRYFDPRVGYFADSYEEFSDNQQIVKKKTFITRWRLEPKPEDVEKMKKGELVEPKKQIVYYIDPATPVQWRKYLKLGVEDWNVAFEQAGFKNAIVAKDWPNDSTMSLEDARYSVIRYLASNIQNAYGPQIHDPRTGEILESHIGWYHNVMSLLHDWYMIQAGCIDKRADKMKFDDELMGQLIRFVSSHEVGHTLGLRHNMGASSATPVDSLRDKKWVEANGHTASIMDYARFNYVAQPEDNIGEKGIYPRINDYDKWAIKWGYMVLPDSKNSDDEKLELNKITIKQLAKGKRYWFGGEGYDNDPRAQTEDLGDDAMKASEYGLKNLRRIVKALPQWTYEEGDLDENIKRMYDNVISQYQRYVGHVCKNIGGVYTNHKSVEQTGNVYTPEEKSRQKRAMAFLGKNVFTEPTWLISESYMTRINAYPEAEIRPIINSCLDKLISNELLGRLYDNSGAKDTYLPSEFVKDLVDMTFTETVSTAKTSVYRRYIQREIVLRSINQWKNGASQNGNIFMYNLLQIIRFRMNTARTTDAETRAHYKYLSQVISLAIDKK
jgi:hypothetical protein